MPSRKRRVRHAEIVTVFAARLRELRQSRGMTQAELARQANVTPAYIWRLETAGAAPGIDLVDRLARALGTTPADLLRTEAEPDTLAVLKGQAKRLFDAVLASADRDDLLALNPLLARFHRSR
jgi:transcriptional regulator with XRE-family HTH domain